MIETIKLEYDKLQQLVKVEATDELDMLKTQQHRQGVETTVVSGILYVYNKAPI